MKRKSSDWRVSNLDDLAKEFESVLMRLTVEEFGVWKTRRGSTNRKSLKRTMITRPKSTRAGQRFQRGVLDPEEEEKRTGTFAVKNATSRTLTGRGSASWSTCRPTLRRRSASRSPSAHSDGNRRLVEDGPQAQP
ncbi:uncharacterized protein LOC120425353 isoform X2 [Culex pipiens pallens]|uniref:uncharacterized protein LOC120425353 isoform X2 n=1 Tax=Culex pipiens pallens TaxID=42434 RepID=UPI0022AAE21F|nr:uncharacterized protein LOC120425353 isoform X2 [Culex pipiens pallens]